MPIIVKKNGSRTEFESSKLRGSLMLALRKRPVAAGAIDAAIASIEEKLLTSGRREVDSVYVGELVMQELKRLDKIAYIRFRLGLQELRGPGRVPGSDRGSRSGCENVNPILKFRLIRLSPAMAGLSSPDTFWSP
jgi:hypothetical protein